MANTIPPGRERPGFLAVPVSTALRRAIYGKLAGDTTLTGMLGAAGAGYTRAIYHDEAPADTEYPFVTLSKSSSVPVDTFGPPAFDNDVWLIKGIDRATTADSVEAIQARVAALLQDASLSISGGRLLYLRRQSDIDYPEVIMGVSYRHAGSLFRVAWASA